mmetsp:Transcript_38814/g.62862  ORF Transcript_38814/g.62862 Transcript_38814/m.62862 type:complete len:90 (-) Transcript_38814:1288-1557(-)
MVSLRSLGKPREELLFLLHLRAIVFQWAIERLPLRAKSQLCIPPAIDLTDHQRDVVATEPGYFQLLSSVCNIPTLLQKNSLDMAPSRRQ